MKLLNLSVSFMIHIEHSIDEPKWVTTLGNDKQIESLCHKISNTAFKTLSLRPSSVEISLVLTNDSHMQSLNQKWRDKNKSTNVLSFPFSYNKNENLPSFLGDIVFAYETIYQEAQKSQISFLAHFTHLFVHGLLHLLGYDHQTKEEAEIMETLEVSILEKLSIANPYKD